MSQPIGAVRRGILLLLVLGFLAGTIFCIAGFVASGDPGAFVIAVMLAVITVMLFAVLRRATTRYPDLTDDERAGATAGVVAGHVLTGSDIDDDGADDVDFD